MDTNETKIRSEVERNEPLKILRQLIFGSGFPFAEHLITWFDSPLVLTSFGSSIHVTGARIVVINIWVTVMVEKVTLNIEFGSKCIGSERIAHSTCVIAIV